MKKISIVLLPVLFLVFLILSYSMAGTASASRGSGADGDASAVNFLGITNTPADDLPTPLPTEYLTPTPVPPTAEPTHAPTSTPTPVNDEGGGGDTPSGGAPEVIPALGIGSSFSSRALRTSPVTQIEIPALNIDSEVYLVPFKKGQWDISYIGNDAGWLETTSLPDQGGNTVIVGHVQMPGKIAGLFAQIDRLARGAKIEVAMEDEVFTYRVVNKLLVKASNTSIVGETDRSTLTLITCYRPSWDVSSHTYLMRIAVIAELEE